MTPLPKLPLAKQGVCQAALISLRVVGFVLLRSSLTVVAALVSASFDSMLAVFTGGRKQLATLWMLSWLRTQALTACCFVVLAAVHVRRRYARDSAPLPHIGVCVARLTKLFWPVFVLALGITAIVNFSVIMYLPLSWQRCRLGLYFGALLTTMFDAAVAYSAHRLVRREITRGAMVRTPPPPKVPSSRQSHTKLHSLLFVSSVNFAVLVLAHGLSAVSIQSQDEVVVVIIICTACKLLFHWLLRRFGPRSQASSVLATVAPIILMETQLRNILQRVQNVGNSAIGIVIMAGVEVVFRVASLILLQRQLQTHGRGQRRIRSVMVMPTASEPTASNIEREQVLQHHAIRVHADMSSEYIAMVSAYIISYFWSNNPAFQLTNEGNATNTTFGLVQLLVEAFVDWFCCTIECWFGVNFSQIQHSSVDVMLITVHMTIGSAGVSAALYAVIPQA